MSHLRRGHLTVLIDGARNNVAGAREELFRAVYDEMRRMAGRFMRGERPGGILQPSALVNEAVLRLIKGGALERADDRRDLFKIIALAMRRTLVDYARKRQPGTQVDIPLEQIVSSFEVQKLDILALDEALEELSTIGDRKGMVVTLKFFGGLTIPQIATTLMVSEATVEGDWRYARAWLHTKLKGNTG